MRTKEQELTYLVRCINEVNRLLRDEGSERHMTPANVERVRRWQRVRRALFHDVERLRQTIPGIVQLEMFVSPDDDHLAWRWRTSQELAFWEAQDNDPLNERVEGRPTLSGKVS